MRVISELYLGERWIDDDACDMKLEPNGGRDR